MTEAGAHEHMAELRAMNCRRTRAAGREQQGRPCGSGPEADPVGDALVGLQRDLCYLEEVPASRIESASGVLDEMAECRKRLATSLGRPPT